jgi:biopolymer transport protein ExbD
MAKKTPGLNTGSMADISFLLLTFFLLTSAINTDQGLLRKLPPPIEKPDEKVDVKRNNVLQIMVNMYDQLLVNGEYVSNVRDLKNRTKEFILNVDNNPNMSDKKTEYIADLDGEFQGSKGVVSLQNDRGTSYNTYIAVQNQLAEAFNEIRDEFSQKHFGKKFADLDKNRKEGVQKLIPVSISEAEPSNYGGRR